MFDAGCRITSTRTATPITIALRTSAEVREKPATYDDSRLTMFMHLHNCSSTQIPDFAKTAFIMSRLSA